MPSNVPGSQTHTCGLDRARPPTTDQPSSASGRSSTARARRCARQSNMVAQRPHPPGHHSRTRGLRQPRARYHSHRRYAFVLAQGARIVDLETDRYATSQPLGGADSPRTQPRATCTLDRRPPIRRSLRIERGHRRRPDRTGPRRQPSGTSSSRPARCSSSPRAGPPDASGRRGDCQIRRTRRRRDPERRISDADDRPQGTPGGWSLLRRSGAERLVRDRDPRRRHTTDTWSSMPSKRARTPLTLADSPSLARRPTCSRHRGASMIAAATDGADRTRRGLGSLFAAWLTVAALLSGWWVLLPAAAGTHVCLNGDRPGGTSNRLLDRLLPFGRARRTDVPWVVRQ